MGEEIKALRCDWTISYLPHPRPLSLHPSLSSSLLCLAQVLDLDHTLLDFSSREEVIDR